MDNCLKIPKFAPSMANLEYFRQGILSLEVPARGIAILWGSWFHIFFFFEVIFQALYVAIVR